MSGKVFSILLIVAYVGLMYWMLFRKPKKERQKREEMNSRVAVGTRLVTISGIYGTVVDMDDRNVVIEISADEGKSIKAKLLRAGIKEIIA